MFDWISDYASWAFDSGFGAIILFAVSMIAIPFVVLGVVQLGAWFVEGFRRGARKAIDERD